MSKYNWSDEQKRDVIEHLVRVKASAKRDKYYGLLDDTEQLLAKLDPRPNFRDTDHECCYYCKHTECALSVVREIHVSASVKTCDNFERAE